jgi:hypothetical protein
MPRPMAVPFGPVPDAILTGPPDGFPDGFPDRFPDGFPDRFPDGFPDGVVTDAVPPGGRCGT